jgi:YfiH family protein
VTGDPANGGVAPIDLFAPLRADRTLAGWIGAASTRAGGASEPPFDSLNLGFSTGDDPDRVRENRRRLAGALGIAPGDLVVPGQDHGARCAAVGRGDRGEGVLAPSSRLRGRDALLLAEPGVFALSLTADCPIVIVADPVGRRGGVAHAGWRGTAAGVVEALLDELRSAGSDLAACAAAIGPGICGECYEVGDEVIDAVARRPGAREATRGRRLDLRAIHRATLVAAGIPPERISISSSCSREEAARFFSHRRDGARTGRAGIVAGWLD